MTIGISRSGRIRRFPTKFCRFINGEIDPDGNEVPESDRVKLQGVWLQPSSKRYYLYGSLASGVLGFVNSDGVGSVGLEAKYDDTLTGHCRVYHQCPKRRPARN